MVASTLTPDCTAALNDASCSRMMGGPAGRPARAGQMISRTSPVALVARTTPGSAGTGTVRGPNVSVPPFAVTDPPPESGTGPAAPPGGGGGGPPRGPAWPGEGRGPDRERAPVGGQGPAPGGRPGPGPPLRGRVRD